MHAIKNSIGILSFALILFAAACSKSNDDNSAPGGNNPPASGLWKITYFFDK